MSQLSKVSTLDLIKELTSRQNVGYQIVEDDLSASLRLFHKDQAIAQLGIAKGPAIVISYEGVYLQDFTPDKASA